MKLPPFKLTLTALAVASIHLSASEIDSKITTGSLLNTVKAAGVRSYSADQISLKGFSTLTDFIQQLPQMAGFQLNNNGSSDTPRSAATANLRGMGNNRTLILVDGRRMPVYPGAQEYEDNFYNIDGFLLSMVERVDILPSGGGAVYGADAVGGVINIILKKTLNEGAFKSTVGNSKNGGRGHQSVSLGVPFQLGGLTGYAMVDAGHQSRLTTAQRDYADEKGPYDTGYWSAYAGYFKDDSLNYHDNKETQPQQASDCEALLGSYARWQETSSKPCRYSHYSERDLSPETDTLSFSGGISYAISDSWHSQTQLYWFQKTTSELAPPQRFGMYLYANENNPNQLKTNREDGDHVYRVLRSINEYGLQSFNMKDNNLSLSGQLTGELKSGELAFYLSYGKKKLQQSGDQIIEKALLDWMTPDPDETIATTTPRWYPMNPMSADIVNRTQGTSKAWGVSETQQAQLIWRSDFILFDWQTDYALTAEILTESYADIKDQQTMAGAFHKYVAFEGDGQRNRYAMGGEFNSQLTDDWTANLALRYDYFDDTSKVDGAFTPVLTLNYASDNWRWHGQVGGLFRAPDLQRLYAGDTTQGKSIRHGLDPNDLDRVNDYTLVTGGATHLTEETGDSWDTALSYQSDHHLITLGLWGINLSGAVFTESTSRLLSQPELYDFTGKATDCSQLNQPGFITNSGLNSEGIALQCIKKASVNLANQRHKGLDLTISGAIGEVGYNVTASKLLSATYQQHAGSDVFAQTEQGFWPALKANITLNYSPISDVGLSLYWSYQGTATGLYNALNESGDLVRRTGKVAAYQQISITVSYDVNTQSTLTLAVNNLLDSNPSFYREDDDDKNHVWPYFDRGHYSPVGRYVDLSYRYRF